MRLKISGRNKFHFNNNVICVMNIATLICKNGFLPTEREIDEAEFQGNWWFERDNRVELLSSANDHWANIKEEGENYMIIEFYFRYDKDLKKKKAMSELMLVFFDFVEEV